MPAPVRTPGIPPRRRWDWSGSRLPMLLATHAETIRDAMLAPLLAGLDTLAADALRRDREGWTALLARLLDGMDLASAMRLLGDVPAERPAQIPDLAWQEAALDAASPAESGFERDCVRGCAQLLAASLNRASIPAAARDRMLSLLPGSPPPGNGEAALAEAILSGRHASLVPMLSGATGLPEPAIADALATGNRRGLVALAWKAGYGMRTARLLQVLAAGVEPHLALDVDADDFCPLGRAELAWQVSFMERCAAPG